MLEVENNLRVLVLTQGVSRIVKPILNSKYKVVGFLESAPRGYQAERKRLSIFGLLTKLYSFIKRQKSLKDVAEDKGIDYRFMLSSDDAGLVEWVEALNPDVIVVSSMSQLLKEKIFNIPRFGAINLHPSMLPSYRGPNPDFWQYYDMEMNPGMTVHYIDKGEDTGDIIFQERVSIELGTKSPERLDKLTGELGVALIMKTLDAISFGKVPRIKQPKISDTARARNLKPEEHKSIIKWNEWSGERVWHVLCGTELWLNALPQPKGIYMGQRWIVGNYESVESQKESPGSIGKFCGRYYVATRDGRIFLRLNINMKKLIIWLLQRD